jgi:hypothetical protein
MSSWFEEKPSAELTKRIEHRAFQLIENQALPVSSTSRRAKWMMLMRFGAGLSFAALIATLVTRRTSDSPETVTSNELVALDLFDEMVKVQSEGEADATAFDFHSDVELLADLDLLENIDELSELTEEELAGESV